MAKILKARRAENLLDPHRNLGPKDRENFRGLHLIKRSGSTIANLAKLLSPLINFREFSPGKAECVINLRNIQSSGSARDFGYTNRLF